MQNSPFKLAYVVLCENPYSNSILEVRRLLCIEGYQSSTREGHRLTSRARWQALSCVDLCSNTPPHNTEDNQIRDPFRCPI